MSPGPSGAGPGLAAGSAGALATVDLDGTRVTLRRATRPDLLVAESAGRVAGTLQLTFIPGLSRRGALRAQIESVRVAPTRA